MKLREKAVFDRDDHIAMMKDPFEWPNAVLPVKRWHNHELETGVLNGSGPTVYETNVWLIAERGTPFSELPSTTYDSFEAVYDAGWRVD